MAPHNHEDGHGNWYGSEAEKRGRLRLIRSPVVGEKVIDSESSSLAHHHTHESGPHGVSNLGFRDPPGAICPEFERHEEATNVELFFDLFFAANLTIFSEVHETTDSEKLASYIGYFVMLWMTWALVGLFDVRFLTDSIFERIARCAHLGVMIGFAVVAPNFDPYDQQAQVFRAMSLTLAVSRITLSLQYLTILFHTRHPKYRRTTLLPLIVLVVVHFVAAMIYLGIAFRFRDSTNSRVYIAWYIIAVVELCLQVGLSLVWGVLSFRNTHLASRMTLLTLIIIGEGIIVIAKNVTVVVKNPDSWTPATIGIVVAAVGTIYCLYQIYFDWNRHLRMAPVRQLIWTFMHLPFHLALTLFVEGSSSFILWWKIIEVLGSFSDVVLQAINPAETNDNFNVTTAWVVNLLNQTVQDLFDQGYSPKYSDTLYDINESLAQLSTLPDSMWRQDPSGDEDWTKFYESFGELVNAIKNSLFASFNIDAIANSKSADTGAQFEEEVAAENSQRFWLVFIYVFAFAGILLMLMNVLYIISRVGKGRWGLWNYIKITLIFLFGLGLALIPLLVIDPDTAANYYNTPWIIPTMLLTYFVVLVISHVPHPPAMFVGRNRMAHSGSEGEGMPHIHIAQPMGNHEQAQREGSLPMQGQNGDYPKTPQAHEAQYYAYTTAEGERTTLNPSPLSNV